jgi:hypothetical protein
MKESFGSEGEFIRRDPKMPNGDKEAIWDKLWELANILSSIKANGCAQRENDLEMIKDLKNDVKWMIRLGMVTLLGVLAVLLKPFFVK